MSTRKPAIDVQTALTVLGSRDPSHDQGELVDLHDVGLGDADLSNANLVGANLERPAAWLGGWDGSRLAC